MNSIRLKEGHQWRRPRLCLWTEHDLRNAARRRINGPATTGVNTRWGGVAHQNRLDHTVGSVGQH
jgi:hypothetical protein